VKENAKRSEKAVECIENAEDNYRQPDTERLATNYSTDSTEFRGLL
jgi:hypothetical protein